MLIPVAILYLIVAECNFGQAKYASQTVIVQLTENFNHAVNIRKHIFTSIFEILIMLTFL